MHIHASDIACESHPLSLALQHVKLGDVLKIRDGIISEFYPGLPRAVYADIAREPHPQQMFSNMNVSLVLRPHPAHARTRGLVSQVQILGLALEAYSGQSNHRVAFIGIIRK